MERKLKLKQQFDSQYDEGGEGKSSFYDDLKKEVEEQASLNRTEWDGMDDAQRVLYEGFRPGMYVRIEIKVNYNCVNIYYMNFVQKSRKKVTLKV
jgi:ribosome biogenesis protein BMS1